MNTSRKTAAAIAARRKVTQAALARVHQALVLMRREKTLISVSAVSRRSGVSRTFLYTNQQARTALTDAMPSPLLPQASDLSGQATQQESTWRQRGLNTEAALKTAHVEILQQRERIGELLGRVRDLEAEWTQDAIQHITTQNTTLKQQVRQLTAENRTLTERLKAARSNLRFQDRRIAELETQILHQPQGTNPSTPSPPIQPFP